MSCLGPLSGYLSVDGALATLASSAPRPLMVTWQCTRYSEEGLGGSRRQRRPLNKPTLTMCLPVLHLLHALELLPRKQLHSRYHRSGWGDLVEPVSLWVQHLRREWLFKAILFACIFTCVYTFQVVLSSLWWCRLTDCRLTAPPYIEQCIYSEEVQQLCTWAWYYSKSITLRLC